MKKITMKKLSLVSSLSSLVLLMACGDDITNDAVKSTKVFLPPSPQRKRFMYVLKVPGRAC